MCYETGVCGPTVTRASSTCVRIFAGREAQGARVARHNLSSDPEAFVANPR